MDGGGGERLGRWIPCNLYLLFRILLPTPRPVRERAHPRTRTDPRVVVPIGSLIQKKPSASNRKTDSPSPSSLVGRYRRRPAPSGLRPPAARFARALHAL